MCVSARVRVCECFDMATSVPLDIWEVLSLGQTPVSDSYYDDGLCKLSQ